MMALMMMVKWWRWWWWWWWWCSDGDQQNLHRMTSDQFLKQNNVLADVLHVWLSLTVHHYSLKTYFLVLQYSRVRHTHVTAPFTSSSRHKSYLTPGSATKKAEFIPVIHQWTRSYFKLTWNRGRDWWRGCSQKARTRFVSRIKYEGYFYLWFRLIRVGDHLTFLPINLHKMAWKYPLLNLTHVSRLFACQSDCVYNVAIKQYYDLTFILIQVNIQVIEL